MQHAHLAALLVVAACGAPRRDDPPPEDVADASLVPTPDGLPVTLDPADALVDAVPIDVDEDGDRDLFALIRSVAPPLRVAVLTRDGDRYGRPRRVDGGILDDVPDAALEVRSARLEAVDEGFVRLSFRYQESCALAESEEAEVEILWPGHAPERPAFSAFRRARRTACPGADRVYLDQCRPAADAGRAAELRIEDGGEKLVLQVASSTPNGEPTALEFAWQGTRFVQPAASVTEVLAAAHEQIERAKAAPADVAVRLARQTLARLDLVCPSTGDRSCHASGLGIPEESLATCAASAERGALHLVVALALARQAQGRGALAALARAREVGAEAAAVARTEREVLRLVAPTPARIVGIIGEAASPSAEHGPRTAPFVWESPEAVVYTRADGDLGRIVVGEGDRGRLRGLEAREALRGRAGDPRAPGGEHAVVGEDAFGVFVCPTEEETRRPCLVAVRAARLDEDDESVCRIVEDRLADPAAVRLTLGPCEGATEPRALGFVDDDHVAIVGSEVALPVVVSLSDPSKRTPMPDGPSPLYAGTSFAPDGSFRIVESDLGVFRVDRTTGRETRILPPGWGPESITVSPNGRRFAAFVATGGARIFELP
jgi:hypothetical protein